MLDDEETNPHSKHMLDDEETNPHFQQRRRPDYPPHEQEPVRPWGHHPHPHPYPHSHQPDQFPQSGRIKRKPRQSHPQPTLVMPRPRSPPEHDRQPSLAPPRRDQPRPESYTVGIPQVQQPQPHPQSYPIEVPSVQQPHTRPQSYPVEVPSAHQPQFHPERQAQPKPPPHRNQPRHGSYDYEVPPHRHNLMYPKTSKTKPLTWFGAVFCVILWLVIILGGLLVLVIYLMYRPRTPHFEISAASLNAAYLDVGYLLNADLTLLANFTNPNKKVNVDFSYVILQLYFDRHLISNQYIEPFSAFNTESKLANVEMVSSQVRLPLVVTQKLINAIQRNRIVFEVDGIFHARSNFGSLLRYSYWLYAHCQIEMTGPPTGIMLANKCRTKD